MLDELLKELVPLLLDDDYGITNDAYYKLQEVCDKVNPNIMDTFVNRVGSADGRVYLKTDC